MKSPIYDIEHLQLFSKKSIRILLEKCGFTGIKIKAVCNCYPLQYWIRLSPFPAKLKSGLISGLRKIKLDQMPIKFPAGNFAVICYKKD